MNLQPPCRPAVFLAAQEPPGWGSIVVDGEEIEPIAYWDFTTGGLGSGTLNGEACEIGDIFGSDGSWGTFVPDGDSIIDGEGLIGDPSFLGDALAEILAGSMAVVGFSIGGIGGDDRVVYDVRAQMSYNPDTYAMLCRGAQNTILHDDTTGALGNLNWPITDLAVGEHKAAIKIDMAADEMAWSIDGGAHQAGPLVGGAVYTAAAMSCSGEGTYIRTVGIYPIVDNEDLETISAL